MQDLAEDLLAMAAEDLATREKLAADGSLFEGYHPEMRAVHERNADRLAAIVAEHGWPGLALVGNEAADAAWLVAQHAISRPALMRATLELLRRPGNAAAVPPWQIAMLDDRIRVFEGRTQRFGTQFDWDERGEMNPRPIEDPAKVDFYRAEVGLPPLAHAIAKHRARGEPCPADWTKREAGAEEFAREVGWR
jgi:hypothetical protein